MPFKKVGDDSYTSPSGRKFNSAQVRLYYANGGKFPSHAEGGNVMALTPTGDKVIPAKPPSQSEWPQSYAKGGPVLGRERSFLKEPDRFRGKAAPKPETTDEDYGKSGKGAKGKDKSLKAIKPHK